MADVDDQYPPPGFQDAGDIADRLAADGLVVDVVQGDAGDDRVERGVGERELAGVAGLDVDSVGDPFEAGVGERRVGRVAGKVFRLPQVHADGAAALVQPFRGGDEEQPPAAADVEHLLVAPPGQAVEVPL